MSKDDYIGKKYAVGSVTFEIVDVEEYPADKVSEQYKDILKFRAGYLVAVTYRGIFIPNITVEHGVIRLNKILVTGRIYERPGAISEVLDIDESMYAYELTQL